MQEAKITIRGEDVIRLVFMKLAEDKESLRSIGKEVLGDLDALARHDHVTAKLSIVESQEMDEGEFKIEFVFAVTDEEYAAATGQQLCVVCQRWNTGCEDKALGSVCDECL